MIPLTIILVLLKQPYFQLLCRCWFSMSAESWCMKHGQRTLNEFVLQQWTSADESLIELNVKNYMLSLLFSIYVEEEQTIYA